MSDLYSTLFKWAHRQDENFLTDAFVFILNRLLVSEPESAQRFIAWLCFGSKEPCGFELPLTITTQVTVKEGRPDIWIRGSDCVALVEVKKDSGLGERQMKRYREILTNSKCKHTRLVLLTQYTVEHAEGEEPPDNDPRWGEVAAELNRLKLKCPVAAYLVDQFCTFLRSQHMTNERVGGELLAGAHAQRNLLVMLRRALEQSGITKFKRSGGWSWIGYYLDSKNYWVGIEYEWPNLLVFYFNDATPDSTHLKQLGWSNEDADFWYRTFDLGDEESGFLKAAADLQLMMLKDFVSSAFAQAKQFTVGAPKNTKNKSTGK